MADLDNFSYCNNVAQPSVDLVSLPGLQLLTIHLELSLYFFTGPKSAFTSVKYCS
jgi:hypothetical protein